MNADKPIERVQTEKSNRYNGTQSPADGDGMGGTPRINSSASGERNIGKIKLVILTKAHMAAQWSGNTPTPTAGAGQLPEQAHGKGTAGEKQLCVTAFSSAGASCVCHTKAQ